MGGTARAPGYLASLTELRGFTAAGLAADPPTAGLAEETFALEAQALLADAALDLADGWDAAEAGDAAVPQGLPRDAAYEVLAATAACAAQEETGRIAVDLARAVEAVDAVSRHVRGAGLGALVRSYCTVAAFDDLQAVAFYQPMPEAEFVSGAWHRPWAGHPLRDELLMAAAAGLLRLRREGDVRRLALTGEGGRVLAEIRERLDAAGVLAERHAMLALAHRNALALSHAPAHGPAHGLPQAWAELLGAACLGAGARVLLCGMAFGADLLVREVAAVVGPEGRVDVVDPAVAVLRHLQHDGAPPMPSQVRLLPGRFDALPLSDAAVDVCLAPAFLHLGEDGRVLAEIRRVLRPGGRLALAVPHAADVGHALVREWLEPLLDLAARLELAQPGSHAVDAALLRHGFVGVQARPQSVPHHPKGALVHLLHRGGVLERVPWRERHHLLQELSARAERLWAPGGGLPLAPGVGVVATEAEGAQDLAGRSGKAGNRGAGHRGARRWRVGLWPTAAS